MHEQESWFLHNWQACVLWHFWKHQATAKVNHDRFQLAEQTQDAHSTPVKMEMQLNLEIRSATRVSCSGTLNISRQSVCLCLSAQQLRASVHYRSGWEASGKSVMREREQTVYSRNKIRIWKCLVEEGLGLSTNHMAGCELAHSSQGPGLTVNS